MNYFKNRNERAHQARKHTRFIDDHASDLVKYSVEHSCIYRANDLNSVEKSKTQTEFKILFSDKKHDEILLDQRPDCYIQKALDSGKRICVQNYASYKDPGGLFFFGSSAQEESLCHCSGLYNILSEFEESFYEANERVLNKGLYTNAAIYSPDVPFMANEDMSTLRKIDVLTCAAPNAGMMYRYKAFTDKENSDALRSRIEYIAKILEFHEVDIFISGSFGCGVFKQKPDVVAAMMMKALGSYGKYPREVVFAIPDEYNRTRFFNMVELQLSKRNSKEDD